MEGEKDVVRCSCRDRFGGRPYSGRGPAFRAAREGFLGFSFRQRQGGHFPGSGSYHGEPGGQSGHHGHRAAVLSVRLFRMVVHPWLLLRMFGPGDPVQPQAEKERMHHRTCHRHQRVWPRIGDLKLSSLFHRYLYQRVFPSHSLRRSYLHAVSRYAPMGRGDDFCSSHGAVRDLRRRLGRWHGRHRQASAAVWRFSFWLMLHPILEQWAHWPLERFERSAYGNSAGFDPTGGVWYSEYHGCECAQISVFEPYCPRRCKRFELRRISPFRRPMHPILCAGYLVGKI